MAEDDILHKRGPLTTTPDLAEPRVLTWRDAIAAERRRLMLYPRGQPDPRANPTKAVQPVETEVTPIYHYTREHDLTNDHLGYGEQVVDELWMFEEGKIRVKLDVRKSQRTRSGRQLLSQDTRAPKKPPAR